LLKTVADRIRPGSNLDGSMYRNHFGLTQRPFAETVDPSWLVALPGRTAILHRLRYGLDMGPGMVAAFGPPGVGKTLLARSLARDHGGPVVHLTYPAMPSAELLALLANEFAELLGHAASGSDDLPSWVNRIRSALAAASARGERPLLIVDEAHLIDDPATFEALRLLLNFASQGAPDLSLVLIGLPDLMVKLPDSVTDRVGAMCEILPLTASETSQYVLGRLERAGAKTHLFGSQSLERLYFESSGLPRRINRLADLALLIAFSRKLSEVSEEIVATAAEDAALECAA
jgi:MSHA biogenesis protein MshM